MSTQSFRGAGGAGVVFTPAAATAREEDPRAHGRYAPWHVRQDLAMPRAASAAAAKSFVASALKVSAPF